MTILQPVWLILLLPLAVTLWHWRPPSRLLTVLHAGILLLVVLAMCSPVVRLPSKAGVVVVVADRSLSMPSGSQAELEETVGLLRRSMSSQDRLAVVSFGSRPAVEMAPGAGEFSGFTTEVDPEGSNLGEALHMAVSLIPANRPGRILLVTDGRWTGQPPEAAPLRAASRNIAIDYRLRSRPAANDLAVLRLEAPSSVTPGEALMFSAWIHSNVPQAVKYELRRGKAIIASGMQQVEPGASRLAFRDRAGDEGLLDYTLSLRADSRDPTPENNRARVLVGVEGARPLLCLPRSAQSELPKLLARGGLDVRARRPEDCLWTLEELSRYCSVLIENTPAEKIGPSGMEMLAAWVSQAGKGLMMTGGNAGYGPGGYFKSPLEDIMPVSMELRQEHRKLAMAVVVALDRSGSMTAPVGGGKVKMDLANLGAAQVVDMLSSMDEFGCLAVDSSAHLIVPMGTVKDKKAIRRKVLRIDSRGGGIFVYEALSNAAAMLAKASTGTRHIILFADAADSEQPGDYVRLLKKCRSAGITVSVIGLGTPGDSDASLLKDIALRGGGRCLFSNNPKELPRLFAQDVFSVARSAFIRDLTPVKATAGLAALSPGPLKALPPVGGYNLCYLREGANLAVVTRDEYKAPLVAAWQAGNGRVLCYTGDADGKFAGPMARWEGVGDFLTGLAKWVAGTQSPLPESMLLTQDLVGGECRIRLHLDPQREMQPLTGPVNVTVLRGSGGSRPLSVTTQMQWDSPDVMSVSVPLSGRQTALAAVRIPGAGNFTLPPICLPYSQEYAPADPQEGRGTVERLARATSGTERLDLAAIWNELPKLPRDVGLAPWLLAAAGLLLLIEVLERRTGAFGQGLSQVARMRLRWPGRRRARQAAAPPNADTTGEPATTPTAVPGPSAAALAVARVRRLFRRRSQETKPTATKQGQPDSSRSTDEAASRQAPGKGTTQPKAGDLNDAFRRARSRARRRTDR